jgi:hypothetical protein
MIGTPLVGGREAAIDQIAVWLGGVAYLSDTSTSRARCRRSGWARKASTSPRDPPEPTALFRMVSRRQPPLRTARLRTRRARDTEGTRGGSEGHPRPDLARHTGPRVANQAVESTGRQGVRGAAAHSAAVARSCSRARSRDRMLQIRADFSGSMRNSTAVRTMPRSAPESQKPRFSGVRLERGTEESNLALRFWRPPCYRYTSPPGGSHCRHGPSQ